MIRGDLIEAKSVQVNGDYRREVMNLGRAHARDGQLRAKVREREERFWRAIALASAVSKGGKGAHGGERAVALSRAMQAHHALSKATGEQRRITGEVQHQVARVMRAKVVLSAFEKVAAKERALRAHRLAERRSEEIDEVALSQRISGSNRPADRPRIGSWSADSRGGGEGDLAGVYMPMDPHKPLVMHASVASIDRDTGLVGANAQGSSGLVSGVGCEVESTGAALQMRMERAGAPLSCRLETIPSGRVGIRMEVESSSLVSALERERFSIMRRLGEIGITIGKLEIHRDVNTKGGFSGFLRKTRRTQEDEDENVIA